MSSHTPEEIRAHVRVYLKVFGALAVLTVVTVGVSYIDLGGSGNIAVALGNAPGSDHVINALKARQDYPDETVQEHVQWALEQHIPPQP